MSQVLTPTTFPQALAVALSKLEVPGDILEEPVLPPGDLRDANNYAGADNFEDGYSDEQLARLVVTIYRQSADAFAAIRQAAFSPQLTTYLRAVDTRILVLCSRTPVQLRSNPQWGATIAEGPVTELDTGAVPADAPLALVRVSASIFSNFCRAEIGLTKQRRRGRWPLICR